MRVGRGIGSGKGKQAGRGGKGQTARSGVRIKGFEGGQMPLHRRLPKRGFTNPSASDINEVNLGRVQEAIDAGKLDAAGAIDGRGAGRGGRVRQRARRREDSRQGRIDGQGCPSKCSAASKSAIAAIEKAGGAVKVLEAGAGRRELRGRRRQLTNRCGPDHVRGCRRTGAGASSGARASDRRKSERC